MESNPMICSVCHEEVFPQPVGNEGIAMILHYCKNQDTEDAQTTTQ